MPIGEAGSGPGGMCACPPSSLESLRADWLSHLRRRLCPADTTATRISSLNLLNPVHPSLLWSLSACVIILFKLVAVWLCLLSVQVAVNGKHTLLYGHRISPEKIDTLGIYGKVNIHSVGFSFSSDVRSTQASTLELTELSGETKY